MRGWLRSEHFARPEHGQIYAVLCDLNAYIHPVDQLTVARQAIRRGNFCSVRDLAAAIGAYNDLCTPFACTMAAGELLAKIRPSKN